MIDIHGDGSDLVFPHHENESSEPLRERAAASVRHLLHNGTLAIGEAKMSKSVGNIVTIRSLLEEHDGETLRYTLLPSQYHQSLFVERRAVRSSQRQP